MTDHPHSTQARRGAASWEDDGGALRRNMSDDREPVSDPASTIPNYDGAGRFSSELGLGLVPLTADEQREMIRLGIERSPVDSYRVGRYRYTSLKDATAQALRHEAV